jgi:CBS domain-containing protein
LVLPAGRIREISPNASAGDKVMHVRDILKAKGPDMVIVGPETAIAAAARLMARENTGLALVCDADQRVLGTISAMDIIRALATDEARVPGMQARAVMNTDVVVCEPGTTVKQALDLMTSRRRRHLPVVEQGVLQGVISARDAFEFRSKEEEFDAEEMRKYVLGVGYH